MAVFDDTLGWDQKLVVFEHGVDWVGGVPTPARAEPSAIPLEATEPLRVECEHFLTAVATGVPPRTDGVEGLRVLTVLARAQSALADDENALVGAGGPPADDAALASTDVAPPSRQVDPTATVHETAVVDGDVQVGPGTRVWHFSHLLGGTTIGADCTLGQNVVVGPDVSVGDRCRIQNNVSVYAGVTLEDGVFCGPSSVFTNVYNPRAEVSRKDEFRATLVREGATIGANATIVCGNEIGAYAFIGAGAVVNRPVPAHALVVGTPARQIGWMSHDGERLGDDLVCPRSGRRYEVADGGLREVGSTGG
ncbi:acetyltransferase [Aquihabitans sp. G128]|nr:acetyltransferase [Aquihabitans sp. G128]